MTVKLSSPMDAISGGGSGGADGGGDGGGGTGGGEGGGGDGGGDGVANTVQANHRPLTSTVPVVGGIVAVVRLHRQLSARSELAQEADGMLSSVVVTVRYAFSLRGCVG